MEGASRAPHVVVTEYEGMLVRISGVLTPEEISRSRQILEEASWVDGKVTAGEQAGKAKHNLQIPEDFSSRARGRRNRPPRAR